ncbi:unnamed protein product [Hydatigera taeniaeformis]|uniref:Uncharacterized protein n=1 Tax=Hydatigena taeniaeformis TaxID=6205 RepID=A0A0R3WTM7_HYDTA|nr:unnamed protein product [Hydatigera taeniaeformis]
MGVKKPKHFVHQQEQQQQQVPRTPSAVTSLAAQCQGSYRSCGHRHNSSKQSSLPKQKSPLASANATATLEGPVQRKKASKNVDPPKVFPIGTTGIGVSAAASTASLPPWQPRKPWTVTESHCEEDLRQALSSVAVENEVGSGGSGGQPGPPTTAWAGMSKSGASAVPHLGDLEFPPLSSAVGQHSVKPASGAGDSAFDLLPMWLMLIR